MRAAGSIGGVIASLLYGSGVLNSGETSTAGNRAALGAPTPGVHGPAASRCHWWVPEVGNETTQTCSGSALRLATGTALSEATALAGECMREGGLSCVLSHEVGFPIPAVFHWDASSSKVAALLNPIRDLAFEGTSPRLRVRVGHPLDDVALATDHEWTTMEFRKRVRVDAIHASAHASSLWPTTEEYDGELAMCLQLLNATVPDECAQVS